MVSEKTKKRNFEYIKNNNLKLENRENGITLVALVITIIIIIILATVTINMAFGDNGLIRQAELAKDLTTNSTKYEEESTANLVAYLNEVMGEDSDISIPETPSTVADAKPDSGGEVIIFDKTTSITDDSGDTVWVPGGFGIHEDSATDADNGIVITDKKRNEFVWIPVENYTTMYTEAADTALSGASEGVNATTDVYSKVRVGSADDSNYYIAGTPNSMNLREPDIVTTRDAGYSLDQLKNVLGIKGDTDEEIINKFAISLVAEYTATYNSIKTYGGFYIGRYELTGTVDNPSVQKKQIVLTNQNWYNFKKACTNIVSTEYAQTTMVYGNQWDEVMSWLKATVFKDNPDKVDTDSSSWGNYSNYNTANGYEEGNEAYIEEAGSKQVSGYSKYWQANNIYDLAGNYIEWTQEARLDCYRVFRGGSPVSKRSENYPDSPFGPASRPTLYVKQKLQVP